MGLFTIVAGILVFSVIHDGQLLDFAIHVVLGASVYAGLTEMLTFRAAHNAGIKTLVERQLAAFRRCQQIEHNAKLVQEAGTDSETMDDAEVKLDAAIASIQHLPKREQSKPEYTLTMGKLKQLKKGLERWRQDSGARELYARTGILFSPVTLRREIETLERRVDQLDAYNYNRGGFASAAAAFLGISTFIYPLGGLTATVICLVCTTLLGYASELRFMRRGYSKPVEYNLPECPDFQKMLPTSPHTRRHGGLCMVNLLRRPFDV